MKTQKIRTLADYNMVAKSQAVQPVESVVPSSDAPVQQITKQFTYQSYFDYTLLERAILSQPTNSQIIQSTMEESQIPGYAIGLHPSSETPVAIEFRVGGQSSSSQAIILKPGQVVRPHGLPRGTESRQFSGFRWGLPFGWLGGGVATLLVFPSPDADVSWNGNKEVIFHRQRMVIYNSGALPTNAPHNWPLNFPWTQALQGSVPVSMQGQPLITVEPTKTIMRLVSPGIATPETMRIIFQGTNDFDTDSAGNVVLSPVGFVDQVWGTFTPVGTGNLAAQFPYIVLGDTLAALGADDGGVALVDVGTGNIAGLYVDVVRYGRL